MRRLAPVIAALVIFFALAENANAAIPPILRRGTRRMWAGGGLGAASHLTTGGFTQFKLIQTFGFHFKRASEGPAIAFDLHESFGGSQSVGWVTVSSGYTTLQMTARFLWDIPIVDGLGLYLSPNAGIGVGILLPSGGSAEAAFNLRFAFKGKLMLGDRGYVYVEPIGIDIFLGHASGSYTRYDFLLGGGIGF